eukprot:jgi/Mesen1/8121/ME000436S07363
MALKRQRNASTPLSDRESNVRLCPPDKERPFTTGTFFSKPLAVSAGKGTEPKLAQVTVFEAEIIHLAWEDKPKIFKGGKQEGVAPMLRLLAAVEDSKSIRRSQFLGWGAADMSDLYFQSHIQLDCHFYPTAGATEGAQEAAFSWGAEAGSSSDTPAFKSTVFFERMGSSLHEYYVILLCPAPVAVEALPGSSGNLSVNRNSSKEGQGGTGTGTGAGSKGSGQADASDAVNRVLYADQFEVQLMAPSKDTDLRMSRLHLCRSDLDSIYKPFEVLLGQDIAKDGKSTQPQGGAGVGEGGEQQQTGVEEDWVPGTSMNQLPSFEVSHHGVQHTLHYLPRRKGRATRVLVNRKEVQVAASEAARLTSRMPGRRVEVGREFKVSLCMRPFANAQPFTPETGKPTFSDARILEWIDAHLLAGFDHIYFFDRDHAKRQRLLLPYVRRGQLLHLPFPDWSEVHFRLAYKKSRIPYAFPIIYEQVLIYELCPMLGRRYGDTWQFHTDIDEFALTPHPENGSLKHQLMRAVAAEEAARSNRINMLSIKRFNFAGITEATRLRPVLSYKRRCQHPLYEKNGWTGWADKLAIDPSINMPL